MSCNPYRSTRNAVLLYYMLLARGSLAANRSKDCTCHLLLASIPHSICFRKTPSRETCKNLQNVASNWS
uniref:Putative secreted peptide n=1 Tax=Anopheles braziliensis TaxID=58242 RepID=A0A2M3ZVF7_9DIPT